MFILCFVENIIRIYNKRICRLGIKQRVHNIEIVNERKKKREWCLLFSTAKYKLGTFDTYEYG